MAESTWGGFTTADADADAARFPVLILAVETTEDLATWVPTSADPGEDTGTPIESGCVTTDVDKDETPSAISTLAIELAYLWPS